MTETKLFQLFQTFNAYELNRFNKFLHSPYHNEDATLIQLYNLLLPSFKTSTHATPEQKAVWKHVKGKAKFDAVKFARLFSDLLKKAEEFLVIDQLKQHESKKHVELIAILSNKQLNKHYNEAAKIARKKIENIHVRDGEYYWQCFQLEATENAFIELQNKRTTAKNILQASDALDAFYIINKLQYTAATLHYKNFLSFEAEMKMMQEVLHHLSQHNYTHIPAISIYYHIVLSLKQSDHEAHFNTLKKLLAQHYSLFPKSAAQNMYAFAVNYCIRKINFGNLHYVKELLALYQQMLIAKLLENESGMLSQFDYKNIVTVGLRAAEPRWTAKFINDYKVYLPKDVRENAHTFNLAKLHFYQKEYDKVISLLQNVAYTDIFYQLDSKTTLMKVYYELGEYLPLMSLKESFNILLRRKKLISEQNRINYMNFIRFTIKLFRVEARDKQKIALLKNNITASTNVADKGWLLEKITEIE